MPYKVKKSGSKYKVTSPNRTMGTHSNKAAAKRQVRAIYANTKKGKHGK